MTGNYTTKHIISALKVAALENPKLHIGTSYLSALKYKKLGLIKSSLSKVSFADRAWSVYTEKDILESIQRVIEFKGKGKSR